MEAGPGGTLEKAEVHIESLPTDLIPVDWLKLEGEVVGGTGVPPGSTDNGAFKWKLVHSPKGAEGAKKS